MAPTCDNLDPDDDELVDELDEGLTIQCTWEGFSTIFPIFLIVFPNNSYCFLIVFSAGGILRLGYDFP